MNRLGQKRSHTRSVEHPHNLVDEAKSESNSEQQQQQPQNEQEQWSRSKKKRMRVRLMKERQQTQGILSGKVTQDATKKNNNQGASASTSQQRKQTAPSAASVSNDDKVTTETKSRSHTGKTGSSVSALQKAFQQRLTGSRFRSLNEELYTSTSTMAFERFQQNPSLFDEYHEGFRHQVAQWPINPVTIIVQQLTQMHRAHSSSSSSSVSLPKKKTKKIVVADFGCGEAELAKQLLLQRDSDGSTGKNSCPFVVHSFDLVANGPNAELITACDATHTPLAAGTVDYGIFCLALMGTNLADFIREGYRVLKPDGRLLIAEVRSRFESPTSSNSGSDASLQEFVQVLDQLGFETYHTDRSNTMFLLLKLRKNGKKPKKDLRYSAKPCIYKRR